MLNRLSMAARMTGAFSLLTALSIGGRSLAAQEISRLTLQEAMSQADHRGYANRIAAAGTESAKARSGAALKGILPTVRAEAGLMRSNDPLGTFGMLMRQRKVTPQAFDPSSLNHPIARSDATTALVVEAPIFNSDAWATRKALGLAEEAARASGEWQRETTRFDVMRAYYGVVLAREQSITLGAAVEAARAHVHQAESAAENGLVTRSDALLANVRAGEIETQLIASEGAAATARLQLALLLGVPGDTAAALPRAVPLLAVWPEGGVTSRADVDAASAGAMAAAAAVRAATLSLMPRINGFARYEWHDPDRPVGGDGMWSLGIMASWSPFSGASELTGRKIALADARAAEAGKQAAVAAAELELQSARISVEVAERALRIAEAAVSQASEVHRVVSRKYDGGLAVISELLEAHAAQLAAQLSETKARYDLLIARAELARARGGSLTTVAAALDAAARD